MFYASRAAGSSPSCPSGTQEHDAHQEHKAHRAYQEHEAHHAHQEHNIPKTHKVECEHTRLFPALPNLFGFGLGLDEVWTQASNARVIATEKKERTHNISTNKALTTFKLLLRALHTCQPKKM